MNTRAPPPHTHTHTPPALPGTWPHRIAPSCNKDGASSNGCRGPILLYTGNEGPITAFWEATGFMQDVLAVEWGALLVYPEPGTTANPPFGAQSLT